MSFSQKMISFYAELDLKLQRSTKVTVLNPFQEAEVMEACKWFHQTFYINDKDRVFLFGINPGRFGAGITGIPFTDPIQVEQLGFSNTWQKRHELSAIYIEALIDTYGGRESFSNSFYISSVCPLGFVKDGKNINYYDENTLIEDTEAFIINALKTQIELGARTDVCFSLGKGKNYAYLTALNQKVKLFDKIIPLPHPRWVMQYKRKQKEYFLEESIATLKGEL